MLLFLLYQKRYEGSLLYLYTLTRLSAKIVGRFPCCAHARSIAVIGDGVSQCTEDPHLFRTDIYGVSGKDQEQLSTLGSHQRKKDTGGGIRSHTLAQKSLLLGSLNECRKARTGIGHDRQFRDGSVAVRKRLMQRRKYVANYRSP